MATAFEVMQKHYQKRDLAAREWKRKGGRVVGYFCDSVPEELILAAGFFPIRISGNPGGSTAEIDKYLEPFHEGFPPAALFAGAKPVYVALEPPDFLIDPDRLRRAFSPRTRAILINTPHNPTGRVFTREELNAVAELCQEFDVLAVTDEIYEHIVYEGHHIPLATLPGMADRTITLGGFGKTFAEEAA